MMLCQAVKRTFIIVADMRGFETLPLLVLNLLKSAQHIVPVRNEQKFVHPQTSIQGLSHPLQAILYPVPVEYANHSRFFSCIRNSYGSCRNPFFLFIVLRRNGGISVSASTRKTMISA